ncbi:hypothetical protein ABFS82_12G094500 [Erythranthe guttata]|uniref:RING-type domain-containing protein n=1 Tax=Erythranthe guttata TaxID=4155 RepID=A0A022QQR1_ERYGU|nr:PREDICTED: uncharacterized protein LOC105967562 [Erythranthe guttata]EYU28835.1 hypothetical protein MIMGU_mgv1a012374mg [Erythranthe guttata]|eukprot:XP_012847618.1 PREDICTED: uncharacterized protein LOC105967562 [Erythranthe guttata]
MWRSISRSIIPGFGRKENISELARSCHDLSDDETSSNASSDEGLECPICWDSFNIVENVPYVLWCGHTLCKNCVLALRSASLKFSAQHIKIPFFVSCPWCNLLTFRFSYKGNLRFPSKNYFLLWMVESRNGDRVNNQYHSSNTANRRMHRLGRQISSINNNNDNNNNRGRYTNSFTSERRHLSLHKSLDLFIRMTAKFPLVILLLIVVFAVPASAAVLMVHMVITVLFALPAFLVLYFAYPAFDWLRREIRT